MGQRKPPWSFSLGWHSLNKCFLSLSYVLLPVLDARNEALGKTDGLIMKSWASTQVCLPGKHLTPKHLFQVHERRYISVSPKLSSASPEMRMNIDHQWILTGTVVLIAKSPSWRHFYLMSVKVCTGNRKPQPTGLNFCSRAFMHTHTFISVGLHGSECSYFDGRHIVRVNIYWILVKCQE